MLKNIVDKMHNCRMYFVGLSLIISSCTVSKVKHNQSVTQEIIAGGDSTVVVRAGGLYEAGKFKRFLLGDHYRDVWLAPVEVPVLDIETAKGGLTILDRGGGMQTYSLKLKGGDGRLYSLRSLQKDPTPLLPLALQYSFIDDLVQDFISGSNPYAAFTLPELGDAAGIYHTNPRLVYLPDTPALGKYRKDFGGMLAMLEEDADEDWSGYEDFGGTENAVSTGTVRDALREDHDNIVDQKEFLRVRLFDMWLGDIDRHNGQYRWGEFEKTHGELYKPIPEDRDNVFFRFEGLIPSIINRKWAFRKFQNFDTAIRDIAGLNFSARHLDRRFLTELSKEDWIAMAGDLRKRLTDEVIEKALKGMPDTVFRITGPTLIETLQARREKLKKIALEYYLILARQVDVIGSDKSEYFEAVRRPGEIEITVFKASDDGDKERQLYHRIFHNDETREIRLYGLDGEDFFFVSGEVDQSPLLRIIGGEDEDTFADSSNVSGLKKKTIYYDDEKENIEAGKEVREVIKPDVSNNTYNFSAFKYDYLGPTALFGLNSDDGLLLGGGVVIKTRGFKKEPYGSYHKIAANYSPKTSAWNFDYEGDFIDVIGELGLNIDLFVRAPNYFTNFYGYGNNTKALVNEEDFYRVRYEEVQFFPGLKVDIGDKNHIKFGPAYQYAAVRRVRERYLELIPTPPVYFFEPSHFMGFSFEAAVRTTEKENKPEKGIKWLSEMQWLSEMNNDRSKMSRIQSALSLYYTIDIPFETTFAVRIGGSSISGDFNFYQASTIGGNSGLSRLGTVRGYGRDRFSGRSSLYQNNEIRIRLLKVPFYYMPFEMGISAHFDQGRVWMDGETSDRWHTGRGGGLWIAPFGRWVFTAVYTQGEEEGMYNVNLGFLF